MVLHNYQLYLHLLCVTVAAIAAMVDPICNRTTPIGNRLSFYGTQDGASVIIDKFLCISCCAQLYDTIEWYKDIVSPSTRIETVSKPNNCNACMDQHSFRLSEEGQVLKVYESKVDHDGMYFCIIRNGSASELLKQTVEIKLQMNEPGDVKADSCKQNMETNVGANVTLCCTFMEIKQDEMDIRWEAIIDNRSFHLEAIDFAKLGYTTFVTNITAHETKHGKYVQPEVTSYLTLYNISMETYGTYVVTSWSNQNIRHGNCTITINPNTVSAGESKRVTIVVCSMVMSFILVTCMLTLCFALYIWKQYHMTIWLLVSDLWPINDDMDEAMYDAFISHSNTDEDRIFAVQVLRPLLERHSFTTCIDVINFPGGGIRFDDGIAAVIGSRRCILVLSPDYINNVHCRYELDAALQDMKNLRSRCLKIIPITFKNTSKHNLNKSKHLERVLVAVRKLKWTPDNVEVFEKKLLSRMAPIHFKKDVHQTVSYTEGGDSFETTDLDSSKSRHKRPFDRFYNPSRSLYREISVISDQHPSLSV